MRTSRLLVTATATLGLLTLPAVSPASAEDSTVVVHDLGELPTDGSYGITYQSCVTPGQVVGPAPAPDVRTGPAPVPLGLRTWGYDLAGPGGAVGPYRAIDSMGVADVDEVSVYAESDTTGVALAEVLEDGGLAAWYGVSETPFPVTAGAWTTVSGIGAVYNWREVTLADGQSTGSTFTGTVQDMLDRNGSGDQSGYLGLAFGCNGGATVHLDDARFGAPADVTTYDLEGPATLTTAKAGKRTVTAGQRVAITGVTRAHDGTPLPRATLILQQRAFGTSAWKKVGTAVATHSGSQVPARLRVRPLLKTSYRWVYRTSQAADGSTSGVVVVQVRTAVTARAADPTVPRGGTVVVTGKVNPRKAGHTVVLRRGTTPVAHTKVTRSGSYRLTVKATTAGLWKLRVRIGASGGTLAGSSRVVRVRVG